MEVLVQTTCSGCNFSVEDGGETGRVRGSLGRWSGFIESVAHWLTRLVSLSLWLTG